MAEALRLIGFEHSVYTWIVRLTLDKLGLAADYVETDPFAHPPDPVLARYTPLDRVPVLEHDGFRLTETAAICGYLNAIGGGDLVPDDMRRLARMRQVIGLVDADVYPVLVRQVFSPGYYLPRFTGAPLDGEAVALGLARAAPVLSVLDDIAREGLQLHGGSLSLADLHLAPMISYAMRVPETAACLERFPALGTWWERMREDAALRRTDPLGPDLPV